MQVEKMVVSLQLHIYNIFHKKLYLSYKITVHQHINKSLTTFKQWVTFLGKILSWNESAFKYTLKGYYYTQQFWVFFESTPKTKKSVFSEDAFTKLWLDFSPSRIWVVVGVQQLPNSFVGFIVFLLTNKFFFLSKLIKFR